MTSRTLWRSRAPRIATVAITAALAVLGGSVAGSSIASASPASISAAAPAKKTEAEKVAKERTKLIAKFEDLADKVAKESNKFTAKAAKKPDFASAYSAAATALDDLSADILAASGVLASATTRDQLATAKDDLKGFGTQRSTIKQTAATAVAALKAAQESDDD